MANSLFAVCSRDSDSEERRRIKRKLTAFCIHSWYRPTCRGSYGTRRTCGVEMAAERAESINQTSPPAQAANGRIIGAGAQMGSTLPVSAFIFMMSAQWSDIRWQARKKKTMWGNTTHPNLGQQDLRRRSGDPTTNVTKKSLISSNNSILHARNHRAMYTSSRSRCPPPGVSS
jgi:hypothetical protein